MANQLLILIVEYIEKIRLSIKKKTRNWWGQILNLFKVDQFYWSLIAISFLIDSFQFIFIEFNQYIWNECLFQCFLDQDNLALPWHVGNRK